MKKSITFLCILVVFIGCNIVSNKETAHLSKSATSTVSATSHSEKSVETKVKETEPSDIQEFKKDNNEIFNTAKSTLPMQSDVPSMSVNKDTFVSYNYGQFHYHTNASKKVPYLAYDFDKDGVTGIGHISFMSAMSPRYVDFEGFYGTKTFVDGNIVTVTVYNHSIPHPINYAAIISDVNDKIPFSIDYDKPYQFDTTGWKQGLYEIQISFKASDDIPDYLVRTYIYVAENGTFACNVNNQDDHWANNQSIIERRKTIDDVVEKYDIRTENCLDNSQFAYPCIDTDIYHRNDRDRWRQLSHDLIDGKDMSDEMATFILADWFIQNIAYDKPKVEIGHSRAYRFNQWDGTYSMWNTKIGVCSDFTNAFVIMLREQGIPATSLESEEHMWTLVYLDDKWREIDLTNLICKTCIDYDTNKTLNNPVSYMTYGFEFCPDKIVSVGDDLWTYERAIR